MKNLIQGTVVILAAVLAFAACGSSEKKRSPGDAQGGEDSASVGGSGAVAGSSAGKGGTPSGSSGYSAGGEGGDAADPDPAVEVAAAPMAVTFGYTLGVRSDGAVVAWGGNVEGEGTVIPGTGGARVLAGFDDIVAVYSNTNADLAITSTGVVIGRGYGREWGAPITDITDSPKKLTHLGKAVAVAPCLNWTFVLRADGSVWSTVIGALSIKAVAGLNHVVFLSKQVDLTACGVVALKADGTAWQLSQNSAIQVGDLPPLVWAECPSGCYGVDEEGGLWSWNGNTLSGARLDWAADVRAIAIAPNINPPSTYSLKTDGTVWLRYGAGTTERQLAELVDIVAIGSDGPILNALREDGTVWTYSDLSSDPPSVIMGLQL